MGLVCVSFASGTLLVRGLPREEPPLVPSLAWDERSACHRAPAMAYADVIRALHKQSIEYDDAAKKYLELPHGARVHREPRPYQQSALDAWKRARGRGVVVLPTGAGKTHVATMAIDDKRRSTLVVAPTLDLVRQWYDVLRATFGMPVGLVGGGEHDVQAITVTTYDSAYLHMEHLGARFGLVVFDECHHLPGATYALSARLCLAPYRLGLTATPDPPRAHAATHPSTHGRRDADLEQLIGPIVYQRDITELAGSFLAEFETETIGVELSPDERAEYEAERAIYREFVQRNGIRMGSPTGWSDFILLSSRSDDGRRAMQGYRRQRELAVRAPAKLDYVEHLLHIHRRDRALIFTQDNATAYEVSKKFLVPVITHQTKVKERSAILAGIADGTYGAVVTSKVLNEGVDVPDANVAIVLSGSGSVREHVQRLGRVLRKKGDKRAILYELVTEGTGETFTSERRREHVAYR